MNAASRDDLSRWFDKGVESGKNFMVVVCDTYDHSDYPCYFDTDDAAKAKMRAPGEMQRVMECYDLRADKNEQMKQRRAMALEV